ncbi:MAG: 50S ribosomal protein L18e [Candidatus Nanohaloarchaea archaeon]|nr:50S ribosomal protein L18e [Candidatus Nanohaloarchaea archaeon]
MEKSNPVLKRTVRKLEEAARKNGAAVYRDAAESLKKSTRDQPAVNLSKIQRNAEEGEKVLVPGKVLGSGRLDKDVEVVSFQASKDAVRAINEAGEFKRLEEFVEENPEGEDVKLLK